MTSEERKRRLAEIDAELASLSAIELRRPEKAQSFGESIFGEIGKDAEWKDVAVALANVIPSGVQMAGDIIGAVTSPVDTAKALGSVGYGAILKGAELIAGEKEGGEEYKTAFKAFMDAMSDRYGGRSNFYDTIVRDPVGFLLDVSPVKAGAARMATMGAKMGSLPAAKVARGLGRIPGVNPITAAARGVESVPKNVATGARGITEMVGSLTTGQPGSTIRAAVESTAGAVEEGSVWRKILRRPQKTDAAEAAWKAATDFKEKLRLKGDVKDPAGKAILNQYDEAVGIIQQEAAEAISRAAARLEGVGDATSGMFVPERIAVRARDILQDIQARFKADFEKSWKAGVDPRTLDVIPSTGRMRPGLSSLDIPRVKRGIQVLFDERNAQDLMTIHQMRIDLDRVLRTAGTRGQSKAILTMMRKHINDVLNDVAKRKPVVKDFVEESNKYAETMKILEDISHEFGTVTSKDTTRINALIQALKDTPAGEYKNYALGLIKEKTGYHLAEAAAGSALSTYMPSGIHARAIAITALGYVNPASIVAFPLVMPKVVGELAAALGYPIGVARKMGAYAEKLNAFVARHPVLQDIADNGADIGTIVTRALEDGLRPPPFPDLETKSTSDRVLGR